MPEGLGRGGGVQLQAPFNVHYNRALRTSKPRPRPAGAQSAANTQGRSGRRGGTWRVEGKGRKPHHVGRGPDDEAVVEEDFAEGALEKEVVFPAEGHACWAARAAREGRGALAYPRVRLHLTSTRVSLPEDTAA